MTGPDPTVGWRRWLVTTHAGSRTVLSSFFDSRLLTHGVLLLPRRERRYGPGRAGRSEGTTLAAGLWSGLYWTSLDATRDIPARRTRTWCSNATLLWQPTTLNGAPRPAATVIGRVRVSRPVRRPEHRCQATRRRPQAPTPWNDREGQPVRMWERGPFGLRFRGIVTLSCTIRPWPALRRISE
jgi:hypothetical protein